MNKSSPCFSVGKGDERKMDVRRDRDLKNVGPASYERSFADKKKEPVYSMGGKLGSTLVRRDASTSPEPGRYNPAQTFCKSRSPSYRIGTEQRAAGYDARKAKLVPGAGTYNPPGMAFNIEKPRFHMGQKLVFDDTKKYIHSIPGPGTHSPTVEPTKKKLPVYSMGAKLQSSLVKPGNVPGPGSYVNSAEKVLRNTAPSFGFGTSQRPAIGSSGGKGNNPGPGSYKIPVRVADVPAYSLPN